MNRSEMGKTILDVLEERGKLPEPELRELVFQRLGYDNWTEFTLEIELLIGGGSIGITQLVQYEPLTIWRTIRTKPISLIPVEID